MNSPILSQSDLSKYKAMLNAGAETLGLALSDMQVDQLLSFIQLLVRWNKKFNLTAIRDPEQMVIKHILDSLTVAPYLQGDSILDVGTGAGIPGIPLSILYPEKQFHLLDSNGKKIRFIVQAIMELKLTRVETVQKRVEEYQYPAKYTTIITRAFSALPTIAQDCRHLLAEKGILLAMKGQNPIEELESVVGFTAETLPLEVPLLNEERHAVILREH